MAVSLHITPATLVDLAAIDRLRRMDSDALGFLSRQALREKIADGSVLLARQGSDSGPVVAFVLHGSTRRREVRLFQLAVDPAYRGRGIARRLVRRLLALCRRRRSVGVSLRCRDDLVANRFWHRCGFDLRDVEQGRRGALLVWVRALENEPIAFHSRWHPCPDCGRITCGAWTAGGVRWNRCERCARRSKLRAAMIEAASLRTRKTNQYPRR